MSFWPTGACGVPGRPRTPDPSHVNVWEASQWGRVCQPYAPESSSGTSARQEQDVDALVRVHTLDGEFEFIEFKMDPLVL